MLRVTALMVGLAALLLSSRVAAHHSFSAEFDPTKAINFKGVVTRVQYSNPHVLVFVEVRSGANVDVWALDGPSLYSFDRKGLQRNFIKVGDVLDVCGYSTLPGVASTVVDSATGKTARKFSAEQLTLPNGQKVAWTDYGARKCY
jgi:hypothetical protein